MEKTDLLQNTSKIPTFDGKYTTIVDFPSTIYDTERILWVNSTPLKHDVDIKFSNGKVYMAFEDESDALIFKIKFL